MGNSLGISLYEEEEYYRKALSFAGYDLNKDDIFPYSHAEVFNYPFVANVFLSLAMTILDSNRSDKMEIAKENLERAYHLLLKANIALPSVNAGFITYYVSLAILHFKQKNYDLAETYVSEARKYTKLGVNKNIKYREYMRLLLIEALICLSSPKEYISGVKKLEELLNIYEENYPKSPGPQECLRLAYYACCSYSDLYYKKREFLHLALKKKWFKIYITMLSDGFLYNTGTKKLEQYINLMYNDWQYDNWDKMDY